MATSSITKRFVINDNEVFERLIEASKKPMKRIKESNFYEDGKKELKKCFG